MDRDSIGKITNNRRTIEREQKLESLLGQANKYLDDVSDKGIQSKLKYMMSLYIGDERGTKDEYKQKLYSMIEKL